MKKLIMASIVASALVGGAKAEHVNLWPLYYSDGSTASIAWPLVSYKDGDDWRVGTIYRDGSDCGVFPFYMDFGSSVVLTPFVVAKDWSGGAILPLAYADFKGDDTFWTVFPTVYSHRWKDGENSTFWAAAGLAGRKVRGGETESQDGENSTFWAAAGLAGRKVRGGETESHWLAPLWWRWPKERRGIFAAGLAGWDHLRDDEKCDWVLPFYWRDKDTFWSVPWACGYDADGKITGWFSLPLLSWCKGDEVHITPIAGKTEHSNWLAPLYYWNDEGTFCTLFGGKTKSSSWILPLYYRDKDAFVSLPIYYRNSEDFFTIPYARKNHTDFFLCGLAGRSRRPEVTNDWVLPLWYRDDSSFCSIPYGCIDESEKTTLNWWGLPLLQTRSGECRGFGIQPIVEYKCDRRIGALERAIDAERLPEELRKSAPETTLPLDTANETLEWLLGLAGSEHSIWGGREHREHEPEERAPDEDGRREGERRAHAAREDVRRRSFRERLVAFPWLCLELLLAERERGGCFVRVERPVARVALEAEGRTFHSRRLPVVQPRTLPERQDDDLVPLAVLPLRERPGERLKPRSSLHPGVERVIRKWYNCGEGF